MEMNLYYPMLSRINMKLRGSTRGSKGSGSNGNEARYQE